MYAYIEAIGFEVLDLTGVQHEIIEKPSPSATRATEFEPIMSPRLTMGRNTVRSSRNKRPRQKAAKPTSIWHIVGEGSRQSWRMSNRFYLQSMEWCSTCPPQMK